ncbi:Clotting factor B [Chionoecetes opilio]|uniref:Clotting factor B n=1 Tax=Chionoecetes opilio TaxID=41210 RepID=A0A8J5BV92_CHIOP|nr:Clotting factor B [Chionoecetes opilio]
MGALLLLLVVVGGAPGAQCSRIVFPGHQYQGEGDACLTPSGAPGTCSRSCGHSSGFEGSGRCSPKDSTSLACCGTSLDGSPDNVIVSPPSVSFDCSASKPQFFGFGTVSSSNPESRHEVSGVTWPWMALVGRKESEGNNWLCAGMLINEHWVLSEAYCFQDLEAAVVRLGEYDFNDDHDGATPQDFSVAEVVPHPDYSPPQAYHSLALVRLSSKVALQKSVSPVCLPWGAAANTDITDTKAKLLTFGNTFGGVNSNSVLKEIEVTVFPLARCVRSYSKLSQYYHTWPQGMGRETLCAGDPHGVKDACIGDSGGPLVTQDVQGRYVVAGIVSQGRGCGHKDYPGIYVNLRYSPYLAWIKKVAFNAP